VKTIRPAVRTSSPMVNAVTSTINTDEPGQTFTDEVTRQR